MYRKNPRILILGAKGMLGRTLFKYFKSLLPNTTWGTHKNGESKNVFSFDANNHKKDFKNLINKINKINYVINCIGITDNKKSLKDLVFVNSIFPHILGEYAKKYKFKLIHVSSDAVFSKLSGKVNEKNKPSPEDVYGMSKLLGESSSKRVLTIRSSFLGFNPAKRLGLLERINQQSDKKIEGYVNQAWSGCTTIQFAALCKWIISNNKFSKIRKTYKAIHFPPLKSSKYDILKNYVSLLDNHYYINKTKSTKISRHLTSVYFDIKMLKMYNTNMQDAIMELISFENDIAYKK